MVSCIKYLDWQKEKLFLHIDEIFIGFENKIQSCFSFNFESYFCNKKKFRAVIQYYLVIGIKKIVFYWISFFCTDGNGMLSLIFIKDRVTKFINGKESAPLWSSLRFRVKQLYLELWPVLYSTVQQNFALNLIKLLQ